MFGYLWQMNILYIMINIIIILIICYLKLKKNIKSLNNKLSKSLKENKIPLFENKNNDDKMMMKILKIY